MEVFAHVKNKMRVGTQRATTRSTSPPPAGTVYEVNEGL